MYLKKQFAFLSLIAGAVLLSVCTASAQNASTSATGVSSPVMSGVPDVLHGKTILLPQDDAALAVVDNTQLYTTLLIPLNSNNSSFQQQGTVNTGMNPTHSTAYAPWSIISSSASGRMFNNGNDVVITLSESEDAAIWAYSYWNPAKGKQIGPLPLNHALSPNGNPIYTKVVMGNFQGNNLQSALLFAESDFGSYVLWQMNIVAAADTNQVDDIDQNGGGPVISADATSPSQAPVSTTIVAGDFNQDGVDEIAVLLRDGQTVQLYTVDPKTLQISPWQTIKLPAALTNPTLAAGRFNSSPNVVLAAIGQQQQNINITVDYIDPITNPQNPSVTIIPTTFNNSTLSGGVFEGAFAQAAPLYNTSQNSLEQLVMGLAYEYDSWHALLIGTFDSKYNFVLQEATGYNGCLLGMEIGNFNNLDSSGNVSPNLQIGLLKNFNGNSQCVPPFNNGTVYVEMRNVDVPQNVAGNPQAPLAGGPTNWLDSLPRTELIPQLGDYNALTSISFLTGDLQGRSERLGAPEHITLTGHIQPNFVLGMPPMHVDWLQPFGGTGESCQIGSSVPGQPECILNLDATPNAVNSNRSDAFSSTFSATGSDATQTSRKSTFSWGIAAKVTEGVKTKFNIPTVASGSVSFKESVGNAYNNVKSEYESQYSTKTEQLKTQTTFDDAVFYTAETQNFYNYPVLGKTDNNGNPIYATFSVPSQVQIGETPGSTIDWYQPVHEPGNVLTYPWSEDALKNEFQPGSISPQASSGCWTVGSISGVNTVSWNNQNQNNVSSGWTDALSEATSLSVSGGVSDSFFSYGASVKFSTQIDVSSSQAWGALNQSVNTATSNQAVALLVPSFDKTATSKFAYSFQNYVFGTTNAVPPYQDSASLLPDNLNVLTTGPLFVGFTADPTSQCGQSGTSFWTDAYSQPDVGFNHPDRWDVNSANEAAFNSPLTPSANQPLISQSFYRMKGLFITTGGPAGGSGGLGAGTVQSVPAGQPIYLTARVYNFSLASTDQANAGSSVHVRFYGQKRCTVSYSDGQAIDLCPNAAFQISGNGRDGDVVIAAIPGFHGPSGQPNWGLAGVSFDTTGYDDAELVFWAVTWIEDANGNVISETPDHGVKLPSFAGKTFANITDIPVEAHSNNVGFYAANHPFYVAPGNNPPSTAQQVAQFSSLAATSSVSPSPADGPLQSINLGLKSQNFRVDQVTNFIAKFTAGASFPGSTVLYFDGDPAQGGKLFDVQTVHPLLAGSSAEHLVRFRAQQCGPHTLYAVSELEGFPATVGSISANVTIDPASEVAGMITYVQNLQLQPFLEQALVSNLTFAQARFQQGNVQSGLGALKVFADLVQLIPLRSNNQLQAQTKVLLGRTQLVQTCEASLQTSPAVKVARN